MQKEIKLFSGDVIARYTETEEKKQALWDLFIKWCEEQNAHSGECIQSDNFVIEAPRFMAEAIDNIVKFESEYID